ncbi:protease modulator HflK [Shewanella sp. WXL01]|uniref:protease modulator HflK n=1 Tax=Shewanella sp. WXL01 TaxID=2709721 RepID=UPI0014384E81|nr:protease modulator HflK [Shewanella sp. WXL01]NKF49844.1 protease modulator HflK [Shewanella sp. WXL01]
MSRSVSIDLRAIWQEFWPKARLLVLVGVPLIYLASGFYSIEMEQRGVLSRFGQVMNSNVPPGMHYRLPWPVDSIEVVNQVELQSTEVAYSQQGRDGRLQPDMITQRGDLAEMAYEIQYSITDPASYLNSANDIPTLIEFITTSELIDYVSQQQLEPLLASGRSMLQQDVRQRVQAALDEFNAGVNVTSILVHRLETPRSIRLQFDRLQIAPAEKRKLVQDAVAERTQKISAAKIAANQYVLEQKNYATKIIQNTKGEMDRFMLRADEINQSESADYLISKEYLQTMEKILSNAKTKIVTPS